MKKKKKKEERRIRNKKHREYCFEVGNQWSIGNLKDNFSYKVSKALSNPYSVGRCNGPPG